MFVFRHDSEKQRITGVSVILFHCFAFALDSFNFSRKIEKNQRFLSGKFDFFSGFAVKWGEEKKRGNEKNGIFSSYL